MAHGQPDFGAYAAKVTVGSLADMAELAARLGSLVTLDRRGDVIFLEDFEAPILNWYGGGEGGGDEQRLYPDRAYMGSQSVYLLAGAIADAKSFIARRFHATPNQRYGMEARIHKLNNDAYYDLEFYLYTGSKLYQAEWRYDSYGQELLIWDSTGHWKSIATGIRAYEARQEWWPAKLVVDSQTMKYVRGLFLGAEYDLSGEAIEESDEIIPPCVHVSAEITFSRLAAPDALFDNIILTQNEP